MHSLHGAMHGNANADMHGKEAEGGLFLTGMASTLGCVATRQSLFQAVEQPQYGNVVTPPLSMPA